MKALNPARTSPEPSNHAYGYCYCGCGEKTKLAPRNNKRLGYIKGQPLKYLHGHSSRMVPKYPEDFYEKQWLGHSTPCWVWQGHLHEGYGSLRGTSAHVYYYRKYKGSIANGHIVHHECANKACVNPNHLKTVTHSINDTLKYYPPFTKEEDVPVKKTKSFRFSEVDIERLEKLAREWEMPQTMVVTQLLKEAAEKNLKLSRK